ncbi:MAG TPA: hypothetical protein DCW60_00930, partial [Sutterella sp.]|nr:hypothetical protein [Sutterella sp.]
MSLIRDVNEMPLSGTHLIEASAGTGKTFTISRLFLRLIVEKGTPISKILVMTFTRKATAELKERLQDVLFRAKKALQDKSFDNDPQIAFLKNEDRQTALTRVESALSDFDEANVFTIHAFCQRVLDDAAFDSATDTGIELDPSQPIYDQTKALFFKRYVPDDSPEMAALVNLGLFTSDPWKTIASVAMHEPDAQFDAVNPDSEDDEALKAGLTMELFRAKYPELHDEVCALCRKSDYDGITHRLSQMLRN